MSLRTVHTEAEGRYVLPALPWGGLSAQVTWNVCAYGRFVYSLSIPFIYSIIYITVDINFMLCVTINTT